MTDQEMESLQKQISQLQEEKRKLNDELLRRSVEEGTHATRMLKLIHIPKPQEKDE